MISLDTHLDETFQMIDHHQIHHVLSDREISLLLERCSLLFGELNGMTSLDPEFDLSATLFLTYDFIHLFQHLGIPVSLYEMVYPDDVPFHNSNRYGLILKNYIYTLKELHIEFLHHPISFKNILESYSKFLIAATKVESEILPESDNRESHLSQTTFYPVNAGFIQYINHLLLNMDLNIPDMIRISLVYYEILRKLKLTPHAYLVAHLVFYNFLQVSGLSKKSFILFNEVFIKNLNQYDYILNSSYGSHTLLPWMKTFLNTLYDAAIHSIVRLNRLKDFKDDLKMKIFALGTKTTQAAELLDYLYLQPVITVNRAINHLDVAFVTANTLLKKLEDLNLLEEQTGFKRNRVYIFKQYLDLFT